MLDLIQPILRKQGFIFQRIDGRTTLEARRMALRRFSEESECTIMLASIGSCGEGYGFYCNLIFPVLPSTKVCLASISR